uniref:Kazal-like domain-containing protein n=1 Tax=Ciona savignyi TaxID=51511 RepID=H2Y9J2_CIOSA
MRSLVLLGLLMCVAYAMGMETEEVLFDCDEIPGGRDKILILPAVEGTEECSCSQLQGRCQRNYDPVCDADGNAYANHCTFCYKVGSQRATRKPAPIYSGPANANGQC